MSQYLNTVTKDKQHNLEQAHSVFQGEGDTIARVEDESILVPRLEDTFQIFSKLCEQIHENQSSLDNKLYGLDEVIEEANQAIQADAKEKQLLQEALLGLIAQLPAGIVCLDVKGQVAYLNPTAKSLFERDLQGFFWRDVIHEEFSPKHDDGFEVSLKNGRIIGIKTQSLCANLSESLGFGQILMLDDLTYTREFQANKARERRLSELGKMSASLAHQIRTPLSTAILYANHLIKYRLSPEKQAYTTQKLLTQLTQIEKQIRDMLFYLRGDLPITEQVRLKEILDLATQSVSSQLDQRGVGLFVVMDLPDIKFNCHCSSLVGAIGNLLCNAIEVSEKDQRVKLKTHVADDKWIINITDQGLGIKDADKDKIFTPFYSTKTNGNGLGMSTAKAIIESHQGKISISSELGMGTEITLSFPLKKDLEAALMAC